MKAIYRKRLLKLADFLDTLPRAKFAFDVIAVEGGKPMREALKAGKTRCGTVGCALGWAPAVFPRQLRWQRVADDSKALAICPRGKPYDVNWGQWNTTVGTASRFFGLSNWEVNGLFHPMESGLGGDATPKQVARHIRKFVATQVNA